MRSFFLICLLLLAVALSAAGQQSAETSTGASGLVVHVPLVICDSKKQHVPGLTKDDLALLENGKERALVSFEEVPPASLAQPDAKETGRAGKPVVFVVFDKTGIPMPRLSAMQANMLRFLATVAQDGELVTVLSIGSERVTAVHSLGTNPAVLAAALREVNNEGRMLKPADLGAARDLDPKLADEVSAEAARIRDFLSQPRPSSMYTSVHAQLGGLQQIGAALKQTRGRKALLWLTAFFPVLIDGGNIAFGPMITGTPEVRAIIGEYGKAIEQLNAARVSVYAIPLPGDESFSFSRTKAGLEAFTRSTGGKLLPASSDFGRAIKEGLQDFAPYYLLAYKPEAVGNQPDWRRIKVKPRSRDIQVRAPEGLFVVP